MAGRHVKETSELLPGRGESLQEMFESDSQEGLDRQYCKKGCKQIAAKTKANRSIGLDESPYFYQVVVLSPTITVWLGVSFKIARRTTGAKGCYFLDCFLQVFNMFLKHFLKVSYKSLSSL